MASTLLIVDDHAGFRAFARALLEAEGFVVVGEAGTGEAALQAALALAPQIVLVDVVLPDLDGFALCARLTEGDRPPLVVLTSSRDAVYVPAAPRHEPGPRVHPQERAHGRGARGTRLASRARAALRAHSGGTRARGGRRVVGLPARRRTRPRRRRRRGRVRRAVLRDRRLGSAPGKPGRASDGPGRSHMVRRELLARPALPPPRAARPPPPFVPDRAPALVARRGDRRRQLRHRDHRAARPQRRSDRCARRPRCRRRGRRILPRLGHRPSRRGSCADRRPRVRRGAGARRPQPARRLGRRPASALGL